MLQYWSFSGRRENKGAKRERTCRGPCRSNQKVPILILRSHKTPSTNMDGCNLVYYLFLISYLVFIFFQKIFSLKNIFLETLNRSYHNLSKWSHSTGLNNSKCMKIWRGLANKILRPSDDLDNFSELPD